MIFDIIYIYYKFWQLHIKQVTGCLNSGDYSGDYSGDTIQRHCQSHHTSYSGSYSSPGVISRIVSISWGEAGRMSAAKNQRLAVRSTVLGVKTLYQRHSGSSPYAARVREVIVRIYQSGHCVKHFEWNVSHA